MTTILKEYCAVRYAYVQWRLNEPIEENSQRWTKVHRISRHADDLTACHIKIPEHPYDTHYDNWIPEGAPRCKRCLKPSAIE
jgi:hypothetical protein